VALRLEEHRCVRLDDLRCGVLEAISDSGDSYGLYENMHTPVFLRKSDLVQIQCEILLRPFPAHNAEAKPSSSYQFTRQLQA
jgi:hypothetical protein